MEKVFSLQKCFRLQIDDQLVKANEKKKNVNKQSMHNDFNIPVHGSGSGMDSFEIIITIFSFTFLFWRQAPQSKLLP